MEVNEEKIDLWCERGVPHNEIRSRLTERTDLECLTAFKWLRDDFKIITDETANCIAEMADKFRSSEQILIQVEPVIRSTLKAENFPANVPLNAVMELNALVVEAYVRAANEVLPLHSLN